MDAVFNWQFTPADISTTDYFHPSRAGQANLADLDLGGGLLARPRDASRSRSCARSAPRRRRRPTARSSTADRRRRLADTTAVTNGTTYDYAVWVARGGAHLDRGGRQRAPEQDRHLHRPADRRLRADRPLWNIGTVFHVTAATRRCWSSAAPTRPGRPARTSSASGTRPPARCSPRRPSTPAEPGRRARDADAAPGGQELHDLGVKESAGSPWSGGRACRPGCRRSSSSTTPRSATSSDLRLPGLRDNQTAPVRVAEDWSMTFGPPGTRRRRAPRPGQRAPGGAGRRAGRPHVDESDDAVRPDPGRAQGWRRPRRARTTARSSTRGTGTRLHRHRPRRTGRTYGYAVWVEAAASSRRARRAGDADRRHAGPGDGAAGEPRRPQSTSPG